MKFLVGHPGPDTQTPPNVYIVNGANAIDLSALDPSIGHDLSGLIGRENLDNYVATLTKNATSLPVSDITPALPLAAPGKIICLGLNYTDHIKEGGYEVPVYPALFTRTLESMIPAGAPMIKPACSDKLDYEVELMVIIGKPGKHITEENALDHVFAYTVFNDGSVRDYQKKTHQWTPGKNFDQTGPIGPFAVTPDELPPGATGLKIESRVGDEILQSATTSDMLWSVARTIATVPEFSALKAGDLLAMGTPPGVGHAKNPPRFLKPGEVIEVEIEGIGICANPIVAEVINS